ncbi:hypothetical protein B0T18DRAFT_487516 [Schizothecium vesticola]|uniref:CFEM domain-containing protein n=1 Tax=Schizothecium vesticola TaxID=314040 RepID=A0AA40F1V7_9PEZI|nr:hypothetical protein B0T18DRAFT_487516 [Schizothecium vesticola]
MMSPTLQLIILFLALEAALAAGPAEEVGKLLICEQTCLTAQFPPCHCPLGNFECLCKCDGLVPNLQLCSGTRCSSDRNQTIQAFIDTNLCPKPRTTSSSSSSKTSSTTSSTSVVVSSTSIFTTTSRAGPPSPTPTCSQGFHGNGTRGSPGCLITGGAGVAIQEWGWVLVGFLSVAVVNAWIGI